MLIPFNNFPLMAPEDSGSGSTLTVDETIKFLEEPDKDDKPLDLEEKPKKESVEEDKPEEEKEEKEEVDDGEEELKEIEEELEEPDDEKLELVVPVRKREILAKYPTLFKDFPALEKSYYRDQQFTEVFPTVQDAKDAVASQTTLNNFEQDLLKGNTEVILKSVKETDPKAFYKIADDYLPTLARVDEKAYNHVIGNLVKHTIVAMVKEGRSSKNEALETAAQILNQFVFGSSEFTQPSNLISDKDTKEESKDEEISQREQEFIRRQFETSRDDLNTRLNNTLKSTIIANIDPKDSMSDYVKKNATREALETVTGLIDSDKRFKQVIDKLWDNAFQNDFKKDTIDRIRSAYLSKAKSLLPSVIKKARNEALKGMGKRVKEDTEEESEAPKQRRSTSDNTENNSGRKIKSAKDIPSGMSSYDFLMQD